MNPVPLLYVATVVVTTGVSIATALGRRNLRERLRRELELVPGPDWSLAHWQPDGFGDHLFTLIGGKPRLGRLSWVHQTRRSGRDFLVAREQISGGESSKSFLLVATRVHDSRLRWFTNGGDVEGALPENIADALRSAPGMRAVIVAQGLLVLRVTTEEALRGALDIVGWAADSLDASRPGPGTPQPTGAGTPPIWEQPPAPTSTDK